MTFKDIELCVNLYKESLVEMGRYLAQAKYNYSELVGEGINTWADFLAQPEIGLTVREANRLIQLAEWTEGIRVPITDLNLATSFLCASRGILDDELIEDAKVLSTKDWKERHYDKVKGEDNAPRTYTYLVMKRCNETGNLTKVYGEDAEKIEQDLTAKNYG